MELVKNINELEVCNLQNFLPSANESASIDSDHRRLGLHLALETFRGVDVVEAEAFNSITTWHGKGSSFFLYQAAPSGK